MMPMTVAELITALQRQDPKAEALTDQEFTYQPVTSVLELNGRVIIA